MFDTPHTRAHLQDLLLKKCKEENRPPTDEELASVAKPPPPSLSALKRRSKRENNCYFCGAYNNKNNMNRHLGLAQDGNDAKDPPNCKVLKGMRDDSLAGVADHELQKALEKALERIAALEQCYATLQKAPQECHAGEDDAMDIDIVPFGEEPSVPEEEVKQILKGDSSEFFVTEYLHAKHFAKPETRNIRMVGVDCEILKKDGRSQKLSWVKQPADFVEKLTQSAMEELNKKYDARSKYGKWKSYYRNRFEVDPKQYYLTNAEKRQNMDDLVREVKQNLKELSTQEPAEED
jgi:hypothetical protein